MGSIHRSKVISTARDWLGYEEGEGNWTIFSKILDDCSYYEPQYKQGQPWCHSFINAIFLISAEPSDRDDDEKKYDAQNYLGGQPSINNLSCGCTFGAGYFRDHGLFYPVKEASIGDVVYFGKRGEESHVGLIVDIDYDDDGNVERIYTVEGNKGDKVAEGSYSVNYNRISGVGKPAFDDYYDDLDGKEEKPVEKPSDPLPEEPEKSLEDLAREVINGDWGNGRERAERLEAAGYSYDAVQAKVNELLGIGNPKPTGRDYTVSVRTKLNVRYGAGMDYPIKYQLDNGDPVTVYETDGDWGRIGDDEWVCMDYLK